MLYTTFRAPVTRSLYGTIAEIETANKLANRYFFSEGAMEFFNSAIHGGVYAGTFFITSERVNDSTPPLYSIRYAASDGQIHTMAALEGQVVSERAFLNTAQFDTLEEAQAAVARFVELLP